MGFLRRFVYLLAALLILPEIGDAAFGSLRRCYGAERQESGAFPARSTTATAATDAVIQRAARLLRADSTAAAVRLLQAQLRVVRTAHKPADELALLEYLMGWVAPQDLILSNQYAAEALHLAKRLRLPNRLGMSYYQLGCNAYQQQELARAVVLLKKAVGNMAQLDSLSNTYGGALASLAGTYLELGKPALARPYFQRGLRLARRQHDALTEFSMLSLWGNGLRETAPDTARRYLHQALRLAQTRLRGNPQGLEAEVYTRLVLMQIAHNQRRWTEVLAASEEVARGARRIGHPEYESEALTTMADALRHLGRSAAGYDTLVRAMVLIDTLRGRTKIEELARQQAQLGAVEQEARIRVLEQEQQIARLSADKQRTRTSVLTGIAVVLALLHFQGIYLYRRVRRSEAQARAANRTKDRLMSIIGHDLRGPVAALQQALPLVGFYADNPDPPQLAALAHDLTLQAKELRNLLDNLLQWSLTQSNAVRNVPAVLTPTRALIATAKLYRPQAEAKGVRLRVEAPPELPAVWADEALLATVLRNLTSNAIKFTPQGGEVVLGLAVEMAPKKRIVCTVRDTGVGMTPEQLSHLFDVTADRSTTGTAGEGGTGLGLLVCHHFVGLLGSKLSVRSRPQHGTVFEFGLIEAAPEMPRTRAIFSIQ